jgi:hypothetical protein
MNIQTCPDQLRRKERGPAAEATMFRPVSQNPRLPQRSLRGSFQDPGLLAYPKTPGKLGHDFTRPSRHRGRLQRRATRKTVGSWLCYGLLLCSPSSGGYSASAPPVTRSTGSLLRGLLVVTTTGLSPASRRQLSGHTSDGLGGLLRPQTPARRHHQAVCPLGLNRHATRRPVRTGNLH